MDNIGMPHDYLVDGYTPNNKIELKAKLIIAEESLMELEQENIILRKMLDDMLFLIKTTRKLMKTKPRPILKAKYLDFSKVDGSY
jgi:hypothetical protein